MGMSPSCNPTNTWLKSLDVKKGPNLRWGLIQCSGGDEGNRTPDLLTASQALSQLSYAPVRRSTIRELGRRCKDNFRKTFRGRGRRSPARSRRRRPAPTGPMRARVQGVWAPRCPTKPAGRAPRAGGAAAARLSGFTPVAPGIPATKPAHLLRLGEIPRPWRLWQKQNRR